MSDNRLTVGFEYRYKLIGEILPDAEYQSFGSEIVNEYILRVKSKLHIYWFVLSGTTGIDYIYKLIHKAKLFMA